MYLRKAKLKVSETDVLYMHACMTSVVNVDESREVCQTGM